MGVASADRHARGDMVSRGNRVVNRTQKADGRRRRFFFRLHFQEISWPFSLHMILADEMYTVVLHRIILSCHKNKQIYIRST